MVANLRLKRRKLRYHVDVCIALLCVIFFEVLSLFSLCGLLLRLLLSSRLVLVNYGEDFEDFGRMCFEDLLLKEYWYKSKQSNTEYSVQEHYTILFSVTLCKNISKCDACLLTHLYFHLP